MKQALASALRARPRAGEDGAGIPWPCAGAGPGASNLGRTRSPRPEARTVKYLILINSNPESRRIWENMPADRRAEGLRAYDALTEDLAVSGELIITRALADPSLTVRVPGAEGLSLAGDSDGPYAEAKEVLAGFYLLECDSIERAVEHAERIPEAAYGLVEVRPIMESHSLPEG